MKRKDAFRKLRTICQRLDQADPATFFVIPKQLFLFGSVLSDKPNPKDIDLIFDYQERPDLDSEDMLIRLTYGKPLPHEEAIIHLRSRMKMIRFELLGRLTLENWRKEHGFEPNIPITLVWQPNMNWQKVVDAIEANPLKWHPEKEAKNKKLQEKVKQVRQEKGRLESENWLYENVIKPIYGEDD